MPLPPETVAILEGVKAAIELIEFFKRRLDDTDRSVIVEIDNLTELTLRRVGHTIAFGGFGDPPQPIIAPRSHGIFTAKNTIPLQGTEGCVKYSGEGLDDVSVCWDNPFAGTSAVSVVLKGTRENRYSLEAIRGSGNIGAHMQYVLWELEGPFSLKAFLQKFHPDFFEEPQQVDRTRSVPAFLKKKRPGDPLKSLREVMKI